MALFLIGCGSDTKQQPDIPAKEFKIQDLSGITFNDSTRYNGDIDHINSNSWEYTSHTNSLCLNMLESPCRKVNTVYQEGTSIVGRITKIKFNLNVSRINLLEPPYWVILYQDWVRINPIDFNGNHPITTLKLKVFNNNLNLCHYRNDWQWGYDYGDDIWDELHNHQENDKGGCYSIDKGIYYNVEILTTDNGKFEFYVNNQLISSYKYQTKSPTEPHVLQWGQYWDKGYNKENNINKNIVLTISDFTLSTYHP